MCSNAFVRTSTALSPSGYQVSDPADGSGALGHHRCSAGSAAGPNLWLDGVVAYANRCTLFGVRYRPYWIMSDLATLCALVYAWAFCQHFPNVSAIGLVTAILFGLLVHKLVLETKAAIGIVAARSFLQDCLLVIMPTFVVASICFGQPMHLMFAFLGTLLPLFGGIVRVGCFLGGCCYGVPSSLIPSFPAGHKGIGRR